MNKLLLLAAKHFSILAFTFFDTDIGLFCLAKEPEEGINNTTLHHPAMQDNVYNLIMISGTLNSETANLIRRVTGAIDITG